MASPLTYFAGFEAAPYHRAVPYLAVWDLLTAVGAWLAFDLADSFGFGTSREWDPASPP